MNRQTSTSAEEARFLALRARGLSREHAERIVSAELGGDGLDDADPFADWTDEEVYSRAGQLGIEDRFGMGREELIAAIRAQ